MSVVSPRYRQMVAWKESFDKIIENYQDAKVTAGTLGCMDYGKVMMGLSGGNTMNVVIPSKSDLVADVELAARQALKNDAQLLDTFYRVYVNMEEEPDTAMPDIDAIRLAVGREFTMRGIAPFARYRKPVSIDRSENRPRYK